MYSIADLLRAAALSFDQIGHDPVDNKPTAYPRCQFEPPRPGARLPRPSRFAPFEPGNYSDVRHRYAHGNAPPTLPPPPPPPPSSPTDVSPSSHHPYEYPDRLLDPVITPDDALTSPPPTTPRRRRSGPRKRK